MLQQFVLSRCWVALHRIRSRIVFSQPVRLPGTDLHWRQADDETTAGVVGVRVPLSNMENFR